MERDDAWAFFKNTGNVDAYLIYKQLEKETDTGRDSFFSKSPALFK